MRTADDGWGIETPAALRDRQRSLITEMEAELADVRGKYKWAQLEIAELKDALELRKSNLETALAASVERVKKAEAERDEAIANLEAMEDAEAARDQRYDIPDD
jgi:septal ring factor EnvC (AmiA/AmiB activator)